VVGNEQYCALLDEEDEDNEDEDEEDEDNEDEDEDEGDEDEDEEDEDEDEEEELDSLVPSGCVAGASSSHQLQGAMLLGAPPASVLWAAPDVDLFSCQLLEQSPEGETEDLVRGISDKEVFGLLSPGGSSAAENLACAEDESHTHVWEEAAAGAADLHQEGVQTGGVVSGQGAAADEDESEDIKWQLPRMPLVKVGEGLLTDAGLGSAQAGACSGVDGGASTDACESSEQSGADLAAGVGCASHGSGTNASAASVSSVLLPPLGPLRESSMLVEGERSSDGSEHDESDHGGMPAVSCGASDVCEGKVAVSCPHHHHALLDLYGPPAPLSEEVLPNGMCSVAVSPVLCNLGWPQSQPHARGTDIKSKTDMLATLPL